MPSFANDVRPPVGLLSIVGSCQSRYYGYIETFGTENHFFLIGGYLPQIGDNFK